MRKATVFVLDLLLFANAAGLMLVAGVVAVSAFLPNLIHGQSIELAPVSLGYGFYVGWRSPLYLLVAVVLVGASRSWLLSQRSDAEAVAVPQDRRGGFVRRIVRETIAGSARLVRDMFVVLGVAAALFGIANYVAYLLMPTLPPEADDVFAHTYRPQTSFSINAYKRIFHLDSDAEALARINASPNFAMHPTLEFITQPVQNRYFHIGLEGVRYEPGWTDDQVRSRLNGSATVFALGGSTMLGHGLAADETLTFHLNKLLPTRNDGAVALNLGAQAYNQSREIKKLIYLLKQGYRPAQVVFLDGWNDIFLASSNMRLEDKVAYHGFVVNRGEIALTPGNLMGQPDYLRLFLESLPLYRALGAGVGPRPAIADIKNDRSGFADGFDFREAEAVHLEWAKFAELHRDRFKSEILTYYRSNLSLLRALADHYRFKLLVFYQPIGLLDPKNPFVRPSARTAAGYRYIENLVTAARSEIAAQNLPMIDISQALNGLDGDRYIDVAHYTPAANRVLADVIAGHLAQQGQR